MELWARQPVPLLVSRAPPPFPAVPSPVTGAPFLSRSSAVPLPFLCRSSQKEGREGGGGGSPAAYASLGVAPAEGARDGGRRGNDGASVNVDVDAHDGHVPVSLWIDDERSTACALSAGRRATLLPRRSPSAAASADAEGCAAMRRLYREDWALYQAHCLSPAQ